MELVELLVVRRDVQDTAFTVAGSTGPTPLAVAQLCHLLKGTNASWVTEQRAESHVVRAHYHLLDAYVAAVAGASTARFQRWRLVLLTRGGHPRQVALSMWCFRCLCWPRRGENEGGGDEARRK